MIFTPPSPANLKSMFYVSLEEHTTIVNKFDQDSKLMDIVAAFGHHPDPSDGEPRRFPPWQQPLVRVGDLYGAAVAYTRSYGLVA